MKFGTLYSYWGTKWQCDYLKTLKRVSDIGFDILEMGAPHLLEMSDYELSELRRAAKDMDMVTACFKFVTGGMEQVKEILMSVFPEVTEEELRYIKIREVVPLFIQLFKFSLVEMKSIGGNPQKN